jgi:hypothetical protein
MDEEIDEAGLRGGMLFDCISVAEPVMGRVLVVMAVTWDIAAELNRLTVQGAYDG